MALYIKRYFCAVCQKDEVFALVPVCDVFAKSYHLQARQNYDLCKDCAAIEFFMAAQLYQIHDHPKALSHATASPIADKRADESGAAAKASDSTANR